METFPISPEDCLILKAFKEVKSLREAARSLNCDPAGLQRKVQRISEDHGFLQKIDGRWNLTSEGQALVAWTEESILSQQKLLRLKSVLRISSTEWFSEQRVIPHLFTLKGMLSEDIGFAVSTPNRSFEEGLFEGSTDFVIVCHPPEDPAIAHKQVGEEKWVVIAPTAWQSKKKQKKLSFEDLQTKPFIRHHQLNPDLILGDNSGDLEYGLTADSLIGVRSAVVNGMGWSFVPKILAQTHLEQGQLINVDHTIAMDRKICVWWLRNRADSKKRAATVCAWMAKANL